MNPLPLIRAALDHRRNQRASRDEIHAQQMRKFRRLVRHAQQRSPYYRNVISEHGIDVERAVPQDFPDLTKSTLMDRFDDIITVPDVTKAGITAFLESSADPNDLMHGHYTVVHTSGTSGQPGYFVYSGNDWARGMAQALRVNPVRDRGRRRLAFLGATAGHYTGVSFAATCRRWPLRYLYDVAIFNINDPLGPVLEGLTAFKPTILMGYASALAILAERQEQGLLRIAPRYIQSSGEPVAAADRARVERAFGVPLFNVYSCTEHLIMGFSRPEFDGMYLFEDDLVFEPQGDKTLVTNLFNRTLPLIRYEMNDVLTPQEDTVGTYPFLKVAEISGRNEEIPVFVNRHGVEDFISPAMIVEFLVPNVRRFQLQLRDKTSCTFRVSLKKDLTDSDTRQALEQTRVRFAEILAQKEMDNVGFQVEHTDDLWADPKTGKFRLIVPAP